MGGVNIPFTAETMGTFVGMAMPLMNLAGVDTRNMTLDKAEDFAALKLVGKELMELGEAGELALSDGTIDPGDLPMIFREARDLPAVTMALAVELKDQRQNPDPIDDGGVDPADDGGE